MRFHKSLLAVAVLGALYGVPAAYAVDPETTVKFDPTGNANYTIDDVQRFDWQSSGDLVIVNQLPLSAVANGAEVTTFAAWAQSAVVGDSVKFRFHAHARLNDFLNSGGSGLTVRELSRNGSSCLAGSGPACFEVTAAVSGIESAELVSPGTIQFSGLTGHYKFFAHFSPNSNVLNTNSAPTGSTSRFNNFSDGVAFLEGDLESVDGSFRVGTGGNNEIKTNVTRFNPKYIRAASGDLTEITSATFDTLTRVRTSLEAVVPVNDPIGLSADPDADPMTAAYLVLAADQRLKGDANTAFRGVAIPEGVGLCRVTFGPIDENEYVLLNPLTGGDLYPMKPNPLAEPLDDYSAGGQVGAPSVQNPTSFGEFTHTNDPPSKKDPQPSGHFVFRSGTNSAPGDTMVQHVVCSQPVACRGAVANGKFKQIDWDGIGSFRQLDRSPTSWGASEDHAGGGSRHYYKVRMVDLGEPGKGGEKDAVCPSTYRPGDAIAPRDDAPECGCPDAYQLEIHQSSDAASPIIYSVGGFINGGNIQIHDLTGNPNNVAP